MDVFDEIAKSSFSLVLAMENEYEKKLAGLAKRFGEKDGVCYVCLSKPYTYVREQLAEDVELEKFVFVDVLSSHYGKQKAAENCIFVEGPDKLNQIQEAVSLAIKRKNCKAVIFDTISSLLIYEQNHDIIKFTHELSGLAAEDVNKVFIWLKDQDLASLDDSENLIKDISMFADKTIDME